jgi:signal transduction histidine kinase
LVPQSPSFHISLLAQFWLGTSAFWPASVSILISAYIGAHYFLERGETALSPWGRSERAAVIGFAVSSLIVSFLIDFQRRTLVRAKIAEQAQAAIAKDNARLLMQAHQAQKELKHSNEELPRANRDLEVFAYSAGHDLKEPLRTITTCAELMQRNTARKYKTKTELF